MAKLSVDKIKNLKQKDETWEVAVRPARAWIRSQKKDPYRPWYVLVISDKDKILRHDMEKEKPTPQELLETIFRAMRRPMFGAGRKHRPTKILFDNQEICNELSPLLEEIGVQAEKKIALRKANVWLKDLDYKLSEGVNTPSLTALPSVTVPLLAKIFEATAAYYRLAPWEMIPAEEFAIEVRYPADAEPRYVIIIGRTGESFGLSVHDNLDALESFMAFARYQKLPQKEFSAISFTFEGDFHLSFDDLDAAEKYGWDIPAKDAYPSIMRFTPGKELMPPTPDDIYWLEGALPAITEFFRDDYVPDEFFPDLGAQQIEYKTIVQTLGGIKQVALILPILIKQAPS
ncbi:MAG TPA: hypothetical protein EYP74_05230 [Anaerolineales bacterium]|nr:hypothetical protein [Anaerolineales bacterium]